MAKHRVARVEEIPAGERRLIEVEGKSIGVFNVAGEFHALENVCCHRGGPVCEGNLFGRLEAEVLSDKRVREYYATEGDVIACPWHGWEYEIPTGQCLADRTYRLRKFPVVVEEESVWVVL